MTLSTLVSKKHNAKKNPCDGRGGVCARVAVRRPSAAHWEVFNKLLETVLRLISGCLLSLVDPSYSPNKPTANI